MAKEIYKSYARMNYNASIYCEMAMEAYYNLKKTVENMEDELEEYLKNGIYINKCAISTVVFSAMCLEAFFNDYLAVYLGDEDYYQGFDSLNPISKLKLICEFLFDIEMDKNSLYYTYTKQLFKYRNEYVHSKSTEMPDSLGAASLEELEEPENEDVNHSILVSEKHNYNLTINLAEDSLKAIKEIAVLFDSHDSNVYAVQKLFGTGMRFGMDDEREYEHHKYALELLNLKRKKYEV